MRDAARKRTTWTSIVSIALAAFGVVTFAQASAQNRPPYETIASPGGGNVYYSRIRGGLTAEAAMGRVLRAVHGLCGDRPQLGKVVKSTTGDVLAAFFSVTQMNQGGTPMKGLALVYVPQSGPGGGAVLLDDAGRFPTTVHSMVTTLKHRLSGGSSGGSQPQSDGAPSHSDAPAAVPVKATSTAKSLKGATSTAALPAQRLVPHELSDGTATLRVPADWQVQPGSEGDVSASGPNGERLRFGWDIPATNSQRPWGNFLGIPYATDVSDIFKEIFRQLALKARKPAPTIDIAHTQEIGMGGQGKSALLFGHFDTNLGRGPQYFVAQLIVGQPQVMNAYQMKLFMVLGPEKTIAAEAKTIASLIPSYTQNGAAINARAIALTQQGIAQTNAFVGTVQHSMHVSDQQTAATSRTLRSSYGGSSGSSSGSDGGAEDASARNTAGMSNILRDQSVVTDTQTGAHGTVSDDVADILTNSDSRYQTVSTGGYIRGIDY